MANVDVKRNGIAAIQYFTTKPVTKEKIEDFTGVRILT